MTLRRSAHCVLAALTLWTTMSCKGPSGDQVFFPTFPPGPVVGPDAGSHANVATANFRLVADVLIGHCGTLDCHGNIARNFRIYDVSGLRLPPNVTGQGGTTDAEYEKTYESLVMIQPEVLSTIYKQGGAHPERWIMITKARGTEVHKGGTPWHAGSDPDRCLTSWISNATDATACANGLVQPPMF